MKIGFFELKKWEEDYFKEKLKAHKLYFSHNSLSSTNVNNVKDIELAVCFIYSDLNSSIMEKLKKLKFIATMSTGFDHIDINYCKKNNIKVSNVPFYGENTVAEHTFALILALSRKIYEAIERTKRDDFSISGLGGFDLKRKTIGIIGPGHIGQHVIKIANGFGMKVIAYSPHQDKKLSKKLNFRWVSLDKLLKESDIITIHVPLNENTKHMLNLNNIKNIKKGAYLINTSRGEVIDTDALLYALDNNILAGAGLDVLEGEEDIKEERELLHKETRDLETFLQNHLLLKEKNVIVTPHCAFYTQEALQRILDTTLNNIKAFLKGKSLNKIV